MDKKILFVMDTFPLGGISKSLLALLAQIKDKYDIDFLLMRKEGLFVPLIPSSVKVISDLLPIEFRSPRPHNIFKYFVTMNFNDWLKWVSYSLTCSMARLRGGQVAMVNAMDVWIAKHTPAIDKHYDAAIAYQGGRCIYYIVEQIDAKVKIGYVHNDYSNSAVDFNMKPADSIYFPKLDHIVTISEICLNSLFEEFPNIRGKFCMVENICSPKLIKQSAIDGDSFDDNFTGYRLVTMGRFDIWQKGIDWAVGVASILKSRNINFRWFFLGDGEQRPQVKQMIFESGVEDCFILMGVKVNPYAYIADADVYVQPSRVEGKSVALDEVKALAKPVVVTNFQSVYDQFIDEKTALIAKMDPHDIANKIERLINEPETRQRLVENLLNEKVGNEELAVVFESLLIVNNK
jgi:glycosyltransferase involved in cell wall biosynthesis